MVANKLQEIVQKEALEIFKNKCKGTICLSTGTGKSKIAIDFIKETDDVVKVLITSPRTNLKENWRKELIKWGLEEWRANIWTYKERKIIIVIENIQTAYKWIDEFDFVIVDEIHTMVTPEYSNIFKSINCKYLIGLTATHDITSRNNKGKYYEKHCPIIYEYYDSAEDGLINKTRFFIIDHYLTNNNIVIVKTKGKSFPKGEANHYEYLTQKIKDGQFRMIQQGSDNWFSDASDWFWKRNGTSEQKFAAMMYLNAIKYRKEFLLNLPSNVKIAKKIKDVIIKDTEDGKVLIFSELTAQINQITTNTVHSHNTELTNQSRMNEFNVGNLRDLGSCQSLTLGLNLNGATHAIMESYIGSATRSKQKKGRLDRLATNKIADMWIIRVIDTQSDKWFEQMTKGFDLSDAVHLNSEYILSNGFTYQDAQSRTKSSFA